MKWVSTSLLLAACSIEPIVQYGVATDLLISRADDLGVSSGFDLDDVTSSADDTTGCGIADYVSELGEPGVDNAIARLIPILEQTEAIVAEALIHQAINNGELLLLFKMSRSGDSPLDDEGVTLSVLRGEGEPLVGTNDQLLSGQTFDIDPTVNSASQDSLGLENGQITAADLTLEIPLEIFDAKLNAVLEGASVRVFWTEDGRFSGYMGGSMDYMAIVDMAMNSNVDPTLAASLPIIFGANADLPSTTGVPCSHISFTFTFEGVSAFVYEDIGY